jgi:hypothetical protein
MRGSAAFLHGKASGRINYNAPTEKSTTDGKGSDQLPRTEENSRPRHTGVDKAARNFRLGPTASEACSLLLVDSSVPSATVQIAFDGGGCIPSLSARGGRARQRSRPRGRKRFPRRNEPKRTDCGALRLPTWQGIGPDQLPRTEREKYHARRVKRTSNTHRRK